MGKVSLDADRIKRQLVDCAAVAHVLGLADGARRQSTGLTVCCPWHAERTPSCSVTIGPDRTLRAYCFGCDQGGDVFSLAAAALGLDVRTDFERVAQELAARCGLDDSAPLPPPPPRRLAPPRPPPLVEVGALWAQCLPVWENPELARALLELRGLDPAVIGDRDLARTLPPDGSLPGWARFNGHTWRDSGHLLIVPLCDALGGIQSLHARSLRPGAHPKGLSPAGHASAGLILTCPLARQVLGGGIPAWWRYPAPPAFIVAEGVPDFLTVACRYGETDGRIARGKFTLIEGDPGEGKSLITLDIAARLSRGLPMPEQQTAAYGPSKVLFLLCEDDLADTVDPRLIAAGAARSNIEVIPRLLQIPQQLDIIEGRIREVGATLLVMDPLNGYIDGRVNTHNDHQVRSALTPLVQMAARLGVAVIGVRHLNKQAGGPAKYRGGGSIAYVGLARSALLVGIDPDDADRRILASSKGNLSTRPDSLRFYIVQTEDKQPRIEWLGTCDVTADQLCALPQSEESRSALHDAEEFLKEQLADGAKSADELYKLADGHKIAQRTLRRARGALHIPKGKVWELPAGKAPSRPDVKAIG